MLEGGWNRVMVRNKKFLKGESEDTLQSSKCVIGWTGKKRLCYIRGTLEELGPGSMTLYEFRYRVMDLVIDHLRVIYTQLNLYIIYELFLHNLIFFFSLPLTIWNPVRGQYLIVRKGERPPGEGNCMYVHNLEIVNN